MGGDGDRVHRPADGGGPDGRTGRAFHEREGVDADTRTRADYTGDDAGNADWTHKCVTSTTGE